MNTPRWNQRFLAGTRGQIIALLRRAGRTVNELAQALDLTDNAVRAQLSQLERDGLVQQSGVRRGYRKPEHAYDLTSEGEQLFPKSYGPVFNLVLDVLKERVSKEEMDALLCEAGRRSAAVYAPAVLGKSLPERQQAALAALADLGGLAEIAEQSEGFLIQGARCPLAALVAAHPEVCRLAETMLTDILGTPVKERCEHGSMPRCRFEAFSGSQ